MGVANKLRAVTVTIRVVFMFALNGVIDFMLALLSIAQGYYVRDQKIPRRSPLLAGGMPRTVGQRLLLLIGPGSEAPSTNLQAPEKPQAPSNQLTRLGGRTCGRSEQLGLDLGILVLIWNL